MATAGARAPSSEKMHLLPKQKLALLIYLYLKNERRKKKMKNVRGQSLREPKTEMETEGSSEKNRH